MKPLHCWFKWQIRTCNESTAERRFLNYISTLRLNNFTLNSEYFCVKETYFLIYSNSNNICTVWLFVQNGPLQIYAHLKCLFKMSGMSRGWINFCISAAYACLLMEEVNFYNCMFASIVFFMSTQQYAVNDFKLRWTIQFWRSKRPTQLSLLDNI